MTPAQADALTALLTYVQWELRNIPVDPDGECWRVFEERVKQLCPEVASVTFDCPDPLHPHSVVATVTLTGHVETLVVDGTVTA